MKININANVNIEVNDNLLNNYLNNSKITLKEFNEQLKLGIYELIYDEIADLFINKEIEIKVYFEKDDENNNE